MRLFEFLYRRLVDGHQRAVGRWLASVGVVGSTAILQLLGFILLARQIGPDGMAVIVAVNAVALVAVELVGFGAGDMLVRDISRNPKGHPRAFGNALYLITITLIPIAAIALGLVVMIAGAYVPLWALALLMAGEILFAKGILLAERIAIGHDEVEIANRYRMVSGAIRFAAVAGFLFAGGSSAAIWSVWYIGATVASLCYCLRDVVSRYGRPASVGRAALRDLGVFYSANHVARALQSSMDKLAVAAFAGQMTVGVYGVASRLASFSTLPAMAISRMTYPRFFEKGAAGIDPVIRYAVRILPAALLAGLCASASLVAFAFVGEALLGVAYQGVGRYLLLLSLLPVAFALQNVAGDILSGADHQAYRVIALVVGILATFVFIWIGARFWGAAGVAVGYVGGLFTTALCTMAFAFFLSRRARRRPYAGPAALNSGGK